jgi:hypothetical protein
VKRQPTEWEKISSEKRLTARIYEEFKKSNSKGTNNPINKMNLTNIFKK